MPVVPLPFPRCDRVLAPGKPGPFSIRRLPMATDPRIPVAERCAVFIRTASLPVPVLSSARPERHSIQWRGLIDESITQRKLTHPRFSLQ